MDERQSAASWNYDGCFSVFSFLMQRPPNGPEGWKLPLDFHRFKVWEQRTKVGVIILVEKHGNAPSIFSYLINNPDWWYDNASFVSVTAKKCPRLSVSLSLTLFKSTLSLFVCVQNPGLQTTLVTCYFLWLSCQEPFGFVQRHTSCWGLTAKYYQPCI